MSGFKGLLLSAGRCAMTYRAIFENDNDEDDVGTVDHINAAPALTYAYPIKFYNFSGMRQPRNLPLRLSKKRGPRTCMLSRCLLLMAIFLLLIHVQTTFRLSATILNDGLVGSRQSPRSLNASIHGRQRKPEMPPNATTITSNNTKQTIAYVISVTSCQRNSTNVLDGAAILGHSIHLASQRSAYDYARYAFVYKPDAADCVPQLEALGWTTKVTETLPVDVEKIQDPELQEWVNKKGCCGVKEFMKLYVYTLDDHPIAVHFDTDVLLLQPMDALFHTMLNQHQSLPDNHVMFQKQPSSTTGFYFTRDYYQGSSYTDDPSQYGVQGGFLVVKPNRTVYNELTSRLMMNETYHYARGWSNLGHTGFWGASQIQGYLSYVYEHVYPGRGIELNRCIYNSMINDDPFHKKTGECLTKESTCEDCRSTEFEAIITVHLTSCNKPWACPMLKEPVYPSLCRQAHRAWFHIRQQLEEKKMSGSLPTEGWHFEYTLGYCQRPNAWARMMGVNSTSKINKRQYVPLQLLAS